MKKQRLIALLALAALSPAALVAEEGEAPPTFVVSPALMDTFEEWSSPTVSAESLALESRPELIEEYAAQTEEHYGGLPIAEIFAAHLPETWSEIVATLAAAGDGETPPPAEILAYAMAGEGAEFQAWQTSLADSGADFHGFLGAHHPEIADLAAQLGPSPASQGVGLRDFAEAKGTSGALDLMDLVQHEFIPLKKCFCWTAVSFDDGPGPDWQTWWEEWYSDSWGSLPKKRKNFFYQVKARGAARDVEFTRRSEHHRSQEKREHGGFTASRMRVQLLCIRTMSTGLQACPLANACTGWLYTNIGYASRVYEDHSVGGIWERDATTLAADYAGLVYELPGFSNLTLFAKGVAVAGSYSGDWSTPYSLATGFYGGFPLYSAALGSTNLTTLKSNLDNPAVSGYAGLAYRVGSAGSNALSMEAGWGNIHRPIQLMPDQTHYFKLYTSHRLFGRGYGGQSDTRNHIDSAAFMVALTRSFSCAPTVIPPVERAFWNYGRAPDAPYDLPTLRTRVRDFARNVGSTVSNVDQTPGQYP